MKLSKKDWILEFIYMQLFDTSSLGGYILEEEPSTNPITDIMGNFFCIDCGAGYNKTPEHCVKCYCGINFLTVARKPTIKEIQLILSKGIKL